MANFEYLELRPDYHQAMVAWREKNFPEFALLEKNWSKHFGNQVQFRLAAKVAKLKNDDIELGELRGRPKYVNAGEMVGNMFYSARDIIRAQCSTELGSIQQHRLTLDAAISDEAKYAVLRIMAEELRHAYQMFWVLDHDASWNKRGHSNSAKETMEELLLMETGSHVLDAFNIEFKTFLDNSVFATIIDLVGKYQLEMQRIFSYAPMAQSMVPMLVEENFHMASGRNVVKEFALKAAAGTGEHSLEDLQKTLNQWFARGLEMFGSEIGGYTAVHFGFKDKPNAQAQAEYIDEVKGIFEDINVAVVCLKLDSTDREEARRIVREVAAHGNALQGIRPEDILHVPSPKFFRRRGLEEYTFRPYDVLGELLTERGAPIKADQYLEYLRKVLPATYQKTRDFKNFEAGYRERETSGGRLQGFFV
ncbi:MAG TPA: Phenylacetic acid catabolic protein [Bdellovibrionota bacterium]|nr:Phenylacetic acid catabolic protein [Bdellovibrionota bacterium]